MKTIVSKNDKLKRMAECKIKDKRNLIISKHENGSYTLGQELLVEEDAITTRVFLKGAIIVDGIDELIGLRDALNLVLSEM